MVWAFVKRASLALGKRSLHIKENALDRALKA